MQAAQARSGKVDIAGYRRARRLAGILSVRAAWNGAVYIDVFEECVIPSRSAVIDQHA